MSMNIPLPLLIHHFERLPRLRRHNLNHLPRLPHMLLRRILTSHRQPNTIFTPHNRRCQMNIIPLRNPLKELPIQSIRFPLLSLPSRNQAEHDEGQSSRSEKGEISFRVGEEEGLKLFCERIEAGKVGRETFCAEGAEDEEELEGTESPAERKLPVSVVYYCSCRGR